MLYPNVSVPAYCFPFSVSRFSFDVFWIQTLNSEFWIRILIRPFLISTDVSYSVIPAIPPFNYRCRNHGATQSHLLLLASRSSFTSRFTTARANLICTLIPFHAALSHSHLCISASRDISLHLSTSIQSPVSNVQSSIYNLQSPISNLQSLIPNSQSRYINADVKQRSYWSRCVKR